MPGFVREKVFVSYSHKDKEWLDLFVEMLRPAVDTEMLDVWTDEQIDVGDDWQQKIARALDEAQVALVLVSAHFLSSKFVLGLELPTILEAARERGLSVHWVPISDALWEKTSFKRLKASWPPEEPLDSLSAPERSQAIRQICMDLLAKVGQASMVSRKILDSLREQVQSDLPNLRLCERVASGQSTVLYRGERDGLPVAVKVIVESTLQRGQNHAVADQVRLAMELKHPAFIKLYDVHPKEYPRYLITEYVEQGGGDGHLPAPTLGRMLEGEGGPLAVDRVVTVLRILSEALSEANERGLVYGVLSPANVLMHNRLTPRISAFGFWTYLAKVQDLTSNFVVNREMLSYMTPEHFYGRPVTIRSDQYALALLALEMLEGKRRVTIRCPADFAFKQTFFANPLPEPKKPWQGRHPVLADILKQMLAEHPEDRWPSLALVSLRLADLESETVIVAKNSYRACCEGKLDFWKAFYDRLLGRCEELRPLFAERDWSAQYRMLDQAIQSLLNFSTAPVAEPTVLSATAASHRRLGLRASHFDAFGDALLKTLEVDCKQPEEVLNAWRSTLAAGLEYMKCRATARAEAGRQTSAAAAPQMRGD